MGLGFLFDMSWILFTVHVFQTLFGLFGVLLFDRVLFQIAHDSFLTCFKSSLGLPGTQKEDSHRKRRIEDTPTMSLCYSMQQ